MPDNELIGSYGSMTEPKSQVYQATHEGENRLPFMYRSFLSFSYGGKYIEDFGFIVSIQSDRIDRNIYAEFDDNVSDSDVLEGQIYWSTHFNANMLDLTLSTDGITEKEYEEFKHYFVPGKSRELILAEHPNRGIYARVASAPSSSLLPFEKDITMKMGGRDYNTKTTLYKGDIQISFVMDEPHWHAIQNILYFEEANGYHDFDAWRDANNGSSQIYKTPDALKIIEEDGIPTVAMLQPDIMFGNNLIAEANPNPSWLIDTADIDHGIVGVVLQTTEGFTMERGRANAKFFYYAGTAPCYPKLTFTLTPTFTSGYISNPRNSFTRPSDPKNFICIESENSFEFKFTTPSLYTAYNQTIKIFKKMNGENVVKVREAIRENVNHWAVRAFANSIISNSGTLNRDESIAAMETFITENSQILPATFSFDSKTGEAIGYFRYYNVSTGNFEDVEEQVGDMVRSDYLVIEDRNYPVDGYIRQWTSSGKTNSYRIWHNIDEGSVLTNVLLEYKPMYL